MLWLVWLYNSCLLNQYAINGRMCEMRINNCRETHGNESLLHFIKLKALHWRTLHLRVERYAKGGKNARFLVKSERPHIFFASMSKESLAFLKYLGLPMNAPDFFNYVRFIFIFNIVQKLFSVQFKTEGCHI